MNAPSRKEVEANSINYNGVVHITAGQTCTLNAWAFYADSASVIGSVTAKVYNSSGTITNLAGVTVPVGFQAPIPLCQSFTLTSGSGYLLLSGN